MDIIIGTAGHIDHGKTSLVKALTGIDADRLPEEKKRGITIDLGFAELDLGDIRIGFVDVPGHERFVKNMLAGASGIDMVLLVVAADEGVMPQTKEHFDICRLLETKTGIIALTKTDMVDDELLELVELETAELVKGSFLEGAPIIPLSAKTGHGIGELKEALKKASAAIPKRKAEKIARLPIDRSFTIKGFGAVVTGTLSAGEINEGDEMEILPPGKKARIRGIQTYGKQTGKATAGQRTALNLGGIDHSELFRGMLLAEPQSLLPTQIFDAQIEVLKDAKRSLKTRQRVRLHIGTAEALARLQILEPSGEILPGENGLAQIRLESPVAAAAAERFIIRQYSPSVTIAGGEVIDPLAQKHRRKELPKAIAILEGIISARKDTDRLLELKLILETAGEHGLSFSGLTAKTGWRQDILKEALSGNISRKSIIEAEKLYISRNPFESLKTKTILEIISHHRKEPLSRGIQRETLREKIFSHLPPEVFRAALAALAAEGKIAAEKDVVRDNSHNVALSPEEALAKKSLQRIYRDACYEVPSLEDALDEAARGSRLKREQTRKVFQLLINSGEIIKISEEFYFSAPSISKLIGAIRDFAAANPEGRFIDVAAFKELAGVSRKYAIPMLEYFDREKITRREGDKRLVL